MHDGRRGVARSSWPPVLSEARDAVEELGCDIQALLQRLCGEGCRLRHGGELIVFLSLFMTVRATTKNDRILLTSNF